LFTHAHPGNVSERRLTDEGIVALAEVISTPLIAVCHFRGPRSTIPKLAIFDVYMVNGTENPYKDSVTGEIVGSRHGRKLAVHSLLQAECARLAEGGSQIIIAGDINIALSGLDGHPNLRTHPHQHVLNRLDFKSKFLDSATSVPLSATRSDTDKAEEG
jgi:exonuclease III